MSIKKPIPANEVPKGKTPLVWDAFGEFQQELLERQLYWRSVGQLEYAGFYLAGLNNVTSTTTDTKATSDKR